MKFIKYSSLLVLVYILVSIELILCTKMITKRHSDYNQGAAQNDLETNDDNSTSTNDEYEYNSDDDDDDDEMCSIDQVLDGLHQYLPDDYEEGKKLPIKKRVDHINETIAIFKRLSVWGESLSARMKPISKRIMSRMSELLYLINLPPECMASLARIGDALQDGQLWAAKFSDSMGMPSSGLLEGGPVVNMGEFDECLSIESEDNKEPKIYGRYCLLSLVIPYPPQTHGANIEPVDDLIKEMTSARNQSMSNLLVKDYWHRIIDSLILYKGKTARFGLCLPSTCRVGDVEKAINEVVYPLLRLPVEVGPNCYTAHEEVQLNIHQLIAICVIAATTILLVIGTITEYISNRLKSRLPKLDLIKKTSRSPISKLLICFSAINNTKQLFAPPKALAALEGLRLLGALQMFFIHIYVFLPAFNLSAKQLFAEYGGLSIFFSGWRHILTRQLHTADVFFILSGLLSCYIFLSKLEKSNGTFNYSQIIILRWFRLVVPIIGMILFAYLVPLTGSGPMWKDGIQWFLEPCYKNWHRNILLTNNIYFDFPLEEYICNPVTWYSAADLQLFLFAPPLIFLIYKYGNIGVTINILIVMVGCVVCTIPRFVFDIPLHFEWKKWTNFDVMMSSFRHSLFAFYQHIVTFVMGILTGFLIRKYKNTPINKWIQVFLWVFCTGLFVAQAVWQKDFFAFSSNPSELNIFLFALFSKIMYSLGVCWLCFAISTGRGGIINSFLSLYCFAPLSRLSLGLYLLHPLVIAYRGLSGRDAYSLNDYFVITTLLFDYIIITILSYILYLLFDAPSANFISFLMGSESSHRSNQQNLECNNNKINVENNINDQK